MFDSSAPQHSSVLHQLAPHATAIAGEAERHSSIEFVPARWKRWLSEAGLEELSAWSIERFDGGLISRADLRSVATDGSTDAELLVATLIWGSGKSNARMRPHIVTALTCPDRDEVLAATGRLAASGDLTSAYSAWSLPGLRAPFFTKWLWASSFRGEPDLRPLILDGRVWNSLDALGWSSQVAAGGSRKWPDRFAAYVESCNDWAQQLSVTGCRVSAEDVEFALFLANGAALASRF